jgi:hypothetical protein
VRLPGYLFNLVTFRAQQIMLGNTATKLVRVQLPCSLILIPMTRDNCPMHVTLGCGLPAP